LRDISVTSTVSWIISIVLAGGLCGQPSSSPVESDSRPNILWLVAEDTSPWLGCYGDEINRGFTPNIDSLAARGVRFSRAFVPAPVCSPCRSALMGGQNQIRFNAQAHRSSRGPAKLYLPDGLKLLPQLMKENGYFTFNLGKTDYNFVWDEAATYGLQRSNRHHIPWETLQANQPFFGQIQTAGGKNNTSKFPADRRVDPASVEVPADYPQNQLYREVVAQHYDAIRMDDDFIGTVLAGLEEAGLTTNTIVVYFSDHGANNLVRHKQMPTEGGLHVPFIVAGPDPFVPAPSVRDDLVNLLDLSATTLAWAGIQQPEWYAGQDLFKHKYWPRTYVAAAKDRMDHTIDRVRTVRSHRFRYTRNFKTDRILLQPQYRDPRPFVKNLWELHAAGKLPPALTQIYFGERPSEEFYDVIRDPCQLHNLAGDPAYAEDLAKHREYLAEWLSQGDSGAQEESAEELAFQAQDHKWGRGVNPEYETVREDSDGDGLSDAWENINGRDPHDGKLLFQFDCGGWQTEGWRPVGDELGNIAGSLGYLDFKLGQAGTGQLERPGLRLDSTKNQGQLVIEVRSSQAVEVTLWSSVEGGEWSRVGSAQVPASSKEILTVGLDQPKWSGTISRLRLDFAGPPGTLVEIDSIAAE
jgi:arylsulfatase A-like enzyme